MKPMATKRRRPRAWYWTLGLILSLGLTLFLLSLYRRAEQKDAIGEGRAAYDRGEWSRAADLARERLKSDAKDLAALRLLARSSIRLGRDGVGASIYGERHGRPKLWNRKTPSCLAWLPAATAIRSRRS